MTTKSVASVAGLLREEDVRNDAPLIVVSRPRFFGVKYDINPWMTGNLDAVDHKLALKQWNAFAKLLARCGAQVKVLDCPNPRAPDVTFVANAGSFLPLGEEVVFVSSRFRYHERRCEEAFFTDELRRAGAIVKPLPFGDLPFEGDGDLMHWGNGLVVGQGIRTSREFVSELGRALPGLVTPLKLIDKRFYHLDTCLFYHSINDREVCWYYPGAFASESLRTLRDSVAKMGVGACEVTEDEARTFCCNAVGVGSSIIAHSFSERLADYASQRGFAVHETPLSEFNKAGGSARCLILRVPRRALSAARQGAKTRTAQWATCVPVLGSV